MDGTGYEDAGDNGDSESFRAAIACATAHHAPGSDPQGIVIPCSFYNHWQADHSLGADWYENRSKPGGEVAFGAHTFQHLTSNRKAYAFWYLLARLSGWQGTLRGILRKANLSIDALAELL